MRAPSRSVRSLVGVVAVVLAASCGSSPDPADPPKLTVYSGRQQVLVEPLLAQLQQVVGGSVEIRYGDTAEMAAQLLEEGDRTRADVFFAQDAGALGALERAGLLAPLPHPVLQAVPQQFRARDGGWVGTSARSRVIFFDPRVVAEADVPETLEEVVDPKWKGRVGYPPTNPSWQAFVTGVRVTRGEEFARRWLTAFAANEPVRFGNNIQLLDGVDAGQVAIGLSNHYYWYERVKEKGRDAVTARVRFVPGANPLGLVNVAGAGVLTHTDQPELARKVVEFLVSATAQQYFADVTAEYPVRPGITSTAHELPPLSSLQPPEIDLADLASLQQTQALLQETGLA